MSDWSEAKEKLWQWGQGMFLIFPLLPTWGSLGLFLIACVTLKQYRKAVLKRPLTWGLIGLTFWLLLTTLTAEYQKEAVLGLANFIPFFIVFLGISLLIETPHQLRRLAELGVVTAIPVAILGLGQVIGNWTTPESLQPLLGWILAENGNPSGRLASVFMYANIAAAYLLVTFTFACGLWVEAYRQRREKLWRWFSLNIIVLIIALALILTSSRNAWGIAFLVTITFIIYLKWRWLLALIGIIISAILGAAFAPSPFNLWLRQIVPRYFWARINDQMYTDRAIETLRSTQWEFTWNLIQENPFFGWGLRNFTALYQEKMEIWLGHPHNLFLMLAAEIGILGMILLLILVGSAIVRASLILTVWSAFTPTPKAKQWQQDKLIFLTFIIAFCALTLFNFLDVTLFDLRINLLAWLLLAAINGVGHYYRELKLGLKLMG